MATKKMKAGVMRACFFLVAAFCCFPIFSLNNAVVASDFLSTGRISEPARLWSPGKLAVDRRGSLFVVDSYKNCIRLFDGKGNYEGQIAVKRPSAVAAGPDGNLYIGSHLDYSVMVYKHGKITGRLGAGGNEFQSITDIAVDEITGDVYVADTKANLVKKYYSSGALKGKLTGFTLPTAVSVTDTGIYVLDAPVRECPQAADGDPIFTAQVTCTGLRVSILDKKGSLVRNIDGSGADQMIMPADMAIDAFDNVFIADASRKAVLVYDRLGAFIGAIAGSPDDLHNPVAVTMSADGRLYVSSSETHSIVELGLAGTVRSLANGSLEFKSQTGAAVSPAALGY